MAAGDAAPAASPVGAAVEDGAAHATGHHATEETSHEARRSEPAGTAHSPAELERMVRSFSLRRSLGASPGPRVPVPVDEGELRWVRQQWRPARLQLPVWHTRALATGVVEDAEGDAPVGEALMGEVSDLQQRVERCYSELNAELRQTGALEQGLSQQEKSLAKIAAEGAALREQVAATRLEVQKHSVDNVALSARVAAAAQRRANANTQAAVLTQAVSELCPGAGLAAGATGAADIGEASSAQKELEDVRTQIRVLVAENEVLERQLEQKMGTPTPSLARSHPAAITSLPAPGISPTLSPDGGILPQAGSAPARGGDASARPQ